MTGHTLLWSTITLLALATIPACGQVNQEMIDRVAAGEVEEARASWWGFDEEDSTEALQAAIDSGAPKLIIENMGKPWIVRPIRLASNQEITFEEDVEVVAKRGEFKGSNDSLFTASRKENITLIGYGATLRMHRSDYADPEQYRRAAWRMVLNIRGSSNINIYGLTLAESGGDGIYLGSAGRGTTNRDIHIKDVICESNYRQGISVITAENLLIESTIMRNTHGTAPQAGIDIEPNNPDDRLVNIVVRDCVTENNSGQGYIVWASGLNADSEPISVRFENCRSINDRAGGFRIQTGNPARRAVGGSVEVINCTASGNRGAGLSVAGKPVTGAEVRFSNCTVISPGAEPILFISQQNADQAVGGVEFVDVRLEVPEDRHPMGYIDNAGGTPLDAITGTLILVRDGEEERVELTAELVAEWMPFDTSMKLISRLELDDFRFRPPAAERAAEGCDYSHACVVRAAAFVFHATEGEQVQFTAEHRQVGGHAGKSIPVRIVAPSGADVHREMAPFEEQVEVSFTAPETGLHRVVFWTAPNSLAITRSSHPLSISTDGGPAALFQAEGDYYFWVPAGTTEFGVRLGGEGAGLWLAPTMALQATLIDPAGNEVQSVDNLVGLHQFEVELARPGEGEAWLLRLDRPTEGAWGACSVDLRGVPPLIALCREALLVPVE